jgi:hypothetical protein
MRGVEIGVAHAASLGLDQDLTRTCGRDDPLLKKQRLAKLFDHRCVHCGCHVILLSWNRPMLNGGFLSLADDIGAVESWSQWLNIRPYQEYVASIAASCI